jgi:hypothetical protein
MARLLGFGERADGKLRARMLTVVGPQLARGETLDSVLLGYEQASYTPWVSWLTGGRSNPGQSFYAVALTSSRRCFLVPYEGNDPVGIDWDRPFESVTVTKYRRLVGWVLALKEEVGGREDVLRGPALTSKKAHAVAQALGWTG